MEDRDIVELYWRRDERALAETASRLDDYCLSIARSVLGDGEDARECVNDAYLAAWNAIPPHRPENLAPFVGKLTRRIAVNALEKRDAVKRGGGQGEVVLEELAECLPSGESVESRVESAELERALRRFVGTLPPQTRQIFVCRYWYMDPLADICQRFGWSESRVKTQLYRARKKLRHYLEKEELL